jgi:hypothetical protein
LAKLGIKGTKMENFEEEFYSITDIEEYCEQTRSMLAEQYSGGKKVTTKEIDEYITLSQVENLVDEFCEDHDEEGLPIISVNNHNNICEAIMQRLQNVGLAKLASDGYLEVAFDESINDFIFWSTDKE